MRVVTVCAPILIVLSLLLPVVPAGAGSTPAALEQAMSDTLDLWREGRYEQLYDRLAHRGRTSREQFVARMRDTSVRPACCFQKLENFKVLNEKRTEATVYARVGLEGTPDAARSSTREFKLTHEEQVWKMQLADVFSIAGVTGRKKHRTSRQH